MNKLFKKSFRMFLLTLVILTMLTGVVFGAPVQENIDAVFNSVNISVEDQKLHTDNILHDGTTYAPLRAVSEILGKEVDWDENTNTASINDSESTQSNLPVDQSQKFESDLEKNINVTYNAVNIEVNNDKVDTDNILYKGTTYVPLRAVSEMLGKLVGWDSATNTASIDAAGDLKAHFLDIGQGDSIFIELPNEENVLIDGGTRSNGDIVLNYLDKHDVDSIDYLIATHPHEDHIGGLVEVINEYDIGDIYMPDVTHTTKAFENLLLAIDNNGYKINKASAGNELVESKDLDLYILAPEDKYKASNLNNHSVVLKLDYKDNSFIFTGDAERESENQMLNMGYDLDADLLKIGHHGSDTSTTSSFLKKVDPDYAIISCGLNNMYGHPNNSVLNKLKANDVEVFRTDLDGTIVANSNGKTISFTMSKDSKTNQVTKPKPKPKKEDTQAVDEVSEEVFITNLSSRKPHP